MMQRCGVRHVTYLVQGHLGEIENGADRDRLHAKMSELEVASGFQVTHTSTKELTYQYVGTLTRRVHDEFAQLTVREALSAPGVVTYAELGDAARPPKTVAASWARMLCHIPNITPHAVENLLTVGQWETPLDFLHALDAKGRLFAQDVLEPPGKRPKNSERLHRFFTAHSYAPADG